MTIFTEGAVTFAKTDPFREPKNKMFFFLIFKQGVPVKWFLFRLILAYFGFFSQFLFLVVVLILYSPKIKTSDFWRVRVLIFGEKFKVFSPRNLVLIFNNRVYPNLFETFTFSKFVLNEFQNLILFMVKNMCQQRYMSIVFIYF